MSDAVETVEVKVVEEGDPDASKSYIFAACCCFISGCFLDFPDCVGCYGQRTCLCMEQEFKCCKAYQNTPGKICICQQVTADCIVPQTCCKVVAQQFCLDTRGAIPCTTDVPCVVAYLCIVCCANGKCDVRVCATIGDINATTTK